VDSFSLAEKIDQQAAKFAITQSALIEVNMHQENGKAGLSENSLLDLLEKAATLKAIRFEGLMCIPDPVEQQNNPRRAFAALREMLEFVNGKGIYAPMQELSMGMSADFGAAILEGSTIIRVGSSLFGERH
jgi:pyridoxal phosphate enzyme (YggS family)